MKRKYLDTSREVRLWLGVIFTGIVAVNTMPGLKEITHNVKEKITNKFKKK